jgi:hypothetical protein
LAALLSVQGLGLAHRYWHGLPAGLQGLVHSASTADKEPSWPQHEKGLLCTLVDHLAAGDALLPPAVFQGQQALDHAWIPSLGQALAFGPAPVAQARGPPSRA